MGRRGSDAHLRPEDLSAAAAISADINIVEGKMSAVTIEEELAQRRIAEEEYETQCLPFLPEAPPLPPHVTGEEPGLMAEIVKNMKEIRANRKKERYSSAHLWRLKFEDIDPQFIVSDSDNEQSIALPSPKSRQQNQSLESVSKDDHESLPLSAAAAQKSTLRQSIKASMKLLTGDKNFVDRDGHEHDLKEGAEKVIKTLTLEVTVKDQESAAAKFDKTLSVAGAARAWNSKKMSTNEASALKGEMATYVGASGAVRQKPVGGTGGGHMRGS